MDALNKQIQRFALGIFCLLMGSIGLAENAIPAVAVLAASSPSNATGKANGNSNGNSNPAPAPDGHSDSPSSSTSAPPKSPEASKVMGVRRVLDSLGREIFKSIRRDQFYAHVSFDLEFDRSARIRVPLINSADLSIWLRFKNQAKPIEIPIVNIETPYAETDKKLSVHWSLKVSDLYGFIELHRGDSPNTLLGRLRFYKGSGTRKGGLVPAAIPMKLSSELLDLKELWLSGMTLKFKLAQPFDDPEQVKRKVVSALFECQAESKTFNFESAETDSAPLEKCVYGFEGEKVRLQYKEALPNYNFSEVLTLTQGQD